ncbi:YfhO family protein [Candidatus Gottesmanbacteria bacterium]|nr:YfhO family protein [Candidatus Gottesmanbacteria bacterium]
MNMKKYENIFIVFLFLIITIFFFHPFFKDGKLLFPGNLLISFYSPWKYETFKGWEHGIPNKPLGFDNLRFFYPLRKEILNQIQDRRMPLWNPYNFSGNVLLANSQSAVFYPLNILYLFIPLIDAWSLLVVSVPLIAGIFTYLFLRTCKLSKISSLFGGVSFAFSGFMIVWMEENPAISHSAIWLPVALYGIRKYFATQSVRFWLLTILAMVFSIFAGFLQISIYSWMLVFSFSLYEFWHLEKRQRGKFLVPLATIPLFSLLIAGIHLVPAFEAYLASPRITASAAYLVKEYLTPFIHLITLVAPDIYGNPGTYNYFGGGFYYDKILYVGLIPFIFCLYTIFNRTKTVYFFVLWGLLTLLLGFSNPFSKLIFWLKIPFISTVTPSRIFYLTAFTISVVAAFGLEIFIKNQNRESFKKTFITILSLFVMAGLFILKLQSASFDPTNALIASRNLMIPLVVFVLTSVFWVIRQKKTTWGNHLAVLLIILSIFHQYYFFKKSLYVTDDKRFEFPETVVIKYLKENSLLNRIIGVGEAQIFPNFLLPYHLFSSDGLDPVFSRRYGEFINVANGREYTANIPRIEARLFLEKEEDFLNKNKLRALSFLGIKYLLVPQDFVLPANMFQKVYDDNKVTIWENKEVFPRCWMIGEVVIRNKPEEILNIIFADEFDLKAEVVLEEKPSGELAKIDGNPGTAEIKEYTSDKVRIKTNIPQNGILFCTETFYPGWKAKVDGKETKIYRADYTFRALVIPEGNHEIVFTYESLSFKYGAIISALGLLVAGTYGAVLRKKVSL